MDIIKTKDELIDFLNNHYPGDESYWTYMVFMVEKPYEVGKISGVAIEYSIREVYFMRDDQSISWSSEPESPSACNESLKTPTETFELEENYDYKSLLKEQMEDMMKAINKPIVDEKLLMESLEDK